MKIIRTSLLTNKVSTKEINVTEDQIQNWKNGALIHKAMPNVSAEDREFIMTGLTPEEWDEMFK